VIELLVLFNLSRGMLTMAQRRGVPATWAIAAPLLWLVGETMGAIVGVALGLDAYGAYPVALGYAVVGAGVGWLLVEYHPAARPPHEVTSARRRR
jgi:hypothetical protein